MRYCLAEERKTEGGFLLKEKQKKNIFRDFVSKEKKVTHVNTCLAGGKK